MGYYPETFTTLHFKKRNEILVPVPENKEPYDYFSVLMDNVLLNNIHEMTNFYGKEFLLLHNIRNVLGLTHRKIFQRMS